MNGILSIYKREFTSYFVTPVAYVFIVIFLFMTGVFAETFAEKDADKDGKITVQEFAGDDKKLKKVKKLQFLNIKILGNLEGRD